MNSSQALSAFIDELIFEVVLSNRHLSAHSELPDSEYRALRFIDRQGCSQMRQIAQFLDVTLPRATNVIDKLVSTKLVSRHNGKDRRCVEVCLTTKGKLIIDEARSIHERLSQTVLEPLSPAERKQILDLIQKCSDSLLKGHSS